MAEMMKYYIGDTGPQLYRSRAGELPFRVEFAGHSEDGPIKDVALNISSSIAGESGGNIGGTVSAADFSAYRAAHFNAFNIAGDLL